MFEKMMKYEKAWSLFCEWIFKKYDKFFDSEQDCFVMSDYNDFIDNDFILSIMPFFFDEYGIDICPSKETCRLIWDETPNTYYKKLNDYFENNRENSMIAACEKAFEILNKQLEDK